MRSASHLRRGAVAVAAALAVLGTASVSAADAATRCKSADMRYPFRAGGPKDFGVFRLRIENGTCATARRIARMWQDDFEAALSNGKERLPKEEGGFAFRTLPATAAQTYRERGTKGSTVINFNYRVPNG